MNSKTLVFIGMILGSTLGGAIPMLWGDSALSMWSLLLSSAGAVVGIYFGYKLSKY